MRAMPRPHRRDIPRSRVVAALAPVSAVLLLVGCSTASGEGAGSQATVAVPDDVASSALFDAGVVHEISVEFDTEAYDAMIDAFTETGDKEWIEGTVTIDGTTIEDVGLRLKGNSSLMGLRSGGDGRGGGMGGASASEPESLPWLVRLDKFVDGQSYEGYSSFVVRSNSSETSLNEAVALELVGLAGDATQLAVATRFQVNGQDAVLRLVIENPDDAWEERNFDGDGVLYKAESSGDYSYRGDDPAAYDEVFDQETDTDDEDLSPLIDFLEFINDSDDATFAAELDQWLDVDAFARYLAEQELVANFDDIDGPGNNSYLHYDETSGRFTVVTWDLNLAFGGFGGGGRGPAGAPEGMELPEGMEVPEGMEPPEGMELPEGGQAPGGFSGRSNILVERFLADETFAARYATALDELRADLYGSGAAQEVLDRWVALLTEQATDLVDAATIESEADAIEAYFTGS
jgi:spore coat protein CotH